MSNSMTLRPSSSASRPIGPVTGSARWSMSTGQRLFEKPDRHAPGDQAIAYPAFQGAQKAIVLILTAQRIDRLDRLRRKRPIGLHCTLNSERMRTEGRVHLAARLLAFFRISEQRDQQRSRFVYLEAIEVYPPYVHSRAYPLHLQNPWADTQFPRAAGRDLDQVTIPTSKQISSQAAELPSPSRVEHHPSSRVGFRCSHPIGNLRPLLAAPHRSQLILSL